MNKVIAAAMAAVPWMCFAQGALDEGRIAYMKAGCYQCHGTVGQGGVGPRLAPKPMPIEVMTVFVRNTPRNMPPYGEKVLPEGELRKIHAYLSGVAASPAAEQIPELK